MEEKKNGRMEGREERGSRKIKGANNIYGD